MFELDYIHYIVVLLVISGIYILGIDVRAYKKIKMKKEKKFATVLGWINVALGLLVLMGNWAYQRWFW